MPARGRHASPAGQGYGFLVSWTIIGTMVPGSGLLAAGRRVLGWTLLAVTLAVAAGAATFILSAETAADAALSMAGLALNPTMLLRAAIGIAIAAIAWIAVVISTHIALRRSAVLTRGQQTMASALVVALCIGIAGPAAYASDLALIQRGLIISVFDDRGQDDEPAVAGERPQVEQEDPWANMPRVNVLLIGSDAGADREGIRPDTLIVASVDTATGDTVMFSLPRNLERVPFPLGTDGSQAWPEGFYCADHSCLINAIWRWAETNEQGYYKGEAAPGLTATRDAVEGTLGLRIDTYAMVNLHGFAQVVDAMGGITLDVPRDIPIGGGQTLSGRKNRISGWIRAGQDVRLNGYQALWFARSREGSDDYDRMRRQRCVLGAIINQADPFTLVKAYPELAAAAKSNMSTDILQSDLEAWVDLALRVKGASVRSLPFTDDVIANRSNPNYERIQTLVQQALQPPAPVASPTGSGEVPTQSPTQGPTQGTTQPGTDGPTPTSSPTVRAEEAQDIAAVC